MNIEIGAAFTRLRLFAVVCSGIAGVLATQQASAVGRASPVGDVQHVNASAPGFQGTPSIARDAVGNYTVAWRDYRDNGQVNEVWARRYSAAGLPLGPQFRVNEAATGIAGPAYLASTADGGFVAVYYGVLAGTAGIVARNYDVLGQPSGPERLLEPSGSPGGVAVTPAGKLAVLWKDFLPGGPQHVFVRLFTLQGQAASATAQVSDLALPLGGWTALSSDAAGRLVAVWSGDRGTGDGSDIFARRLAPTGKASGAEFRVNTTVAGRQEYPSVAAANDGLFVVAWASELPGNDLEVRAQRFSFGGTPQGGEIVVSPDDSRTHSLPKVAMDASGDFAVVWDAFPDVFVRYYRRGGTPTGEIRAATSNGADSGGEPSAADMDADGDMVLAWHVGVFDSTTQTFDYDVYARRFAGPEDIDLGVEISSDEDSVMVRTPADITIDVANNHAVDAIEAVGAASGVAVTVKAPAGSKIVSIGGDDWTCVPTSTVSAQCALDDPLLSAGEAAPLEAQIIPPYKATEMVINATLTGNQYDSVKSNALGQVTIPVRR